MKSGGGYSRFGDSGAQSQVLPTLVGFPPQSRSITLQAVDPGAAGLPRNAAAAGIPQLPPLPPLPDFSPRPQSVAAAPAPAAGESGAALECSLPERFVEGMAATVLFKLLRPWRGTVETALSIVDGGRTVAGPAVRRGPVGPDGAEIALNVRPDVSGSMSVCVRAENRFDGALEPEVWTAPLVMLVEPREQASSPFTINIRNEGDLADISLGSLADRIPRAATSAERLRAVANRRAFEPMHGCVLASAPTRLTVETGEGLLHLVARRPAWFGRQSERPEKGRTEDNAVVLRPASGSPGSAEAALCISRTHFMVGKNGAACLLRDGAPARDASGNILRGGVVACSGGGTEVDGTLLPPCGAVSIRAGETCRVVLAPGARSGGALALELSSVPDSADSRVSAGALLRRGDGVRESYLALWGEAGLGAACGRLRGFAVRWDGARFVLRGPDGEDRPLAAGDAFGPQDFPARAVPFKQAVA